MEDCILRFWLPSDHVTPGFGHRADLVARGLGGVRLMTSDAHAGLVEAIVANLPVAAWQRCRTHYAANLRAVYPKSMWPAVKATRPQRLRPAHCYRGARAIRPAPGVHRRAAP